MKNINEIYNEGYVMIDGGYLIDHPHFKYISEMSISEAHQELLKIEGGEDPSDTLYFYQNEQFETLFYISRTDRPAIGRFYKVEDKFQDSTFINEKDKDIIANIVGRIDCNGREIKLGDYVTFENEYTKGRVVWAESGFYIYDDILQELTTDLACDMKIIKLNQ